jgi:hypothetical protein
MLPAFIFFLHGTVINCQHISAVRNSTHAK